MHGGSARQPRWTRAQALADLTEISSQIEAAVVLDADGAVARVDARRRSAGAIRRRPRSELLAAAERAPATGRTLAQLEVATGDGSVFVVRDGRADDRRDDRPGADRRASSSTT